MRERKRPFTAVLLPFTEASFLTQPRTHHLEAGGGASFISLQYTEGRHLQSALGLSIFGLINPWGYLLQRVHGKTHNGLLWGQSLQRWDMKTSAVPAEALGDE